MHTLYQHRQIGTVMLCITASTGLLVAMAAPATAPNYAAILPIILFAAVILGVTGILFSSMTVRVHENALSWYFGPGFWKKTIPLTNIEKATATKTKWYWGYGIKYFGPKRWLYNVSGTDAVELRLRNGGWVRLGTDDVTGLMQALRSRGL